MIVNNKNNDQLRLKNLIPLGAQTEELLFDIIRQQKHLVDNNKELTLEEINQLGLFDKDEHKIRCVINAQSNEDYKEKLNVLITGKKHRDIFKNLAQPENPAKVAFVYSGMGPQWWGMGRELYMHYDIFKQAIDNCDYLIHKHAGWSLLKEMFQTEENSRMDQTWLAQPANFALQVGLTKLWKHWGVHPAGVVGHSIGETTAFYVSGIHTLEEALLINLHRGRLQHKLRGKGKMLAIGMSSDEVSVFITNKEKVRIAAENSRSSVTLAGDEVYLEEIFRSIPDDVFKKYLNVNIPYHGHCMDQIKAELEYELSALNFDYESKVELFSSVTGKKWIERYTPNEYWWRNTSDTVYFKKVIEEMLSQQYNVFVEIGPHKALLPSIKETVSNKVKPYTMVSSLVRGANELENLQKSISSIYCSGVSVNWNHYNKDLYNVKELINDVNF